MWKSDAYNRGLKWFTDLIIINNLFGFMTEGLKGKTVKGVAWSAVERFSTLFTQVGVNIILARILMPEDFGMIAILAVFIQFSQAFIDSGFTNALIQRKNRTNVDFCTVFYFNFVVACLLYVILYISAPWIAEFYNMPALTKVTRILGINLVIGALASVHRTKLSIDLRFKVQSIISFLSVIVSGLISILMAYNKFGIWALVFQSIISLTLQTILLYALGTHWIPSLVFSVHSFKKLFAYSSKILGSSLISLLYRNLYPLAIGKRFSAVELGYYSRADLFSTMPTSSITLVLSKVAFPIFSTIQEDNAKLRIAYSKYIVFASLIVFPIMLGLAALSKPLIVVCMTDKWLMTVPLLQILCFDCMFDHISAINLNILYVKGRSDLALKLEIIKKSIAIIILFVALPFGILAICWGRLFYSLIAIFLNTYYTRRLIGLPLLKQINDFMPYLLCSIVMAITVWLSTYWISSMILQIVIGMSLGIALYVLLILIFQRLIFMEFCDIIKSYFSFQHSRI